MSDDAKPDNVIPFPGVTRHDIPAKLILQAAIKANVSSCIIMGELEDGEPYLASSIGSLPEINWLIDGAKDMVREMAIEDEED